MNENDFTEHDQRTLERAGNDLSKLDRGTLGTVAQVNIRLVAELTAQKYKMLEALKEIAEVIKGSQGVAGYHLNGDVADWDSFNLKLFDAIAKAEE